ncbi:MAG: glycosyltransferase family 39 protein [Thermoguttaceae bacterium]
MKDVGSGALEIALGPRGPTAGPPALAPAAACTAAPVQQRGQGALSASRALLALAIIVAGGVGLRMYGLYGRSMWFDEGFSWRTIQFPFLEMIERTGRDNHPPLYYILLRLWTAAFGESLVALRSMNLAVSALAMAGIYLCAVEAFARSGDRARARWIGLVAAALFAVSTYQIRAAWEVRMYAMGTALVALSTWLLLRALFAPVQRWGAWAAYAAAALAFAYTHYYALYSLVGQAAFAVGFLLVGSCAKVGECFQEGSQDASTTIAGQRRRAISPLPRRAFLRPSSVNRTPAGMTSPGHCAGAKVRAGWRSSVP